MGTTERKNNIVKCLACGEVLESLHRHDYKTCGCSNRTMVDGGSSYMRRGGKDLSLVEVIQSANE